MSSIKQSSKDPDLIMIPEKKTFGQKITDLFIEYRYLLLAFVIPVFIMYLLYVSIGLFPFGDKTVLGLDLNAQYVDYYYGLRNVVHGDADALYTFARSLGGEFMGIYSYYVASPFALIVALFPRNMMSQALLVLLLFKTGLSGFTFGFYLHKTYKFKNKTAIVGFSILYALSAYAVVQQSNSMWIDALVWLPILTYGLEQLIKFGRYKIFVIFLTITIISNFYTGYMMCFYVVLYFLFYYIANPKEKINPTGEKKHFIKSGLRFGAFSLLAAAIAAVIILTTWYSLNLGKTSFTDTKWFAGFKFNLFELIPKFFTGSYDSVDNSGMPLIYCGIITVLLVPLYFCAKQFKIREKLAYAGLMLVFILSFWISDLDLMWHGMQKPQWLPYRYSFLLIFVLLVIAYRAFSNIRNTSSNAIVTSTFCITLVIIVCGTIGLKNFNLWAGFLLSALLVIGYAVFLIFISKNNVKKSILTFSMVGLICIEAVANGVYTMHAANADALGYTSYNRFTTYFDKAFDVADALYEYDPSFYRMENLGTRDSIKKNDGMAIGMRGVSGSTSTLNAKTISFLHNIGYRASGHLSYYSGHCNVNDSLLGIKYVLSRGNNNTTAAMNSIVNGYLEDYKEVKIEGYDGEFKIFENPYALPFAYGVNSNYADLKFDESVDAPLENLNDLVGAMLGDPDYKIFEEILLYGDIETGSAIKDVSYGTSIEGDTYAKYYIDSSDKSAKEDDKTVIFTFSIPEGADGEDLYFYMPWAVYERQVNVSISSDGSKYEKVANGYGKDGYYALLVGNYQAGTTVKLRFVIDNNNSNLWLGVDSSKELISSGLYYLDSDKYTSAMKTLAEGVTMDIDHSSTDAHIHGSINDVKDDKQLIFTSIPYDAGWIVTVDGKAVEAYESNDSLLYFYVDKGDHSVSLDYSPSSFKYGLIISAAGVAVFAILCATEFVLKKKGIKCAVFSCPSNDETVDIYPDEHIYDEVKIGPKNDAKKVRKSKKKRK